MALRLTLHDAIMSLGLETHQALEGGSTGSRSNLNAVAAVFIGLLDDDGDFIAMVCGGGYASRALTCRSIDSAMLWIAGVMSISPTRSRSGLAWLSSRLFLPRASPRCAGARHYKLFAVE